jgi:hypothetical protein
MEQETILKGSINGYSQFLNSNIWKDIKNELELWDQLAVQEYAEAEDLKTVGRIAGKREAISFMLQLPDMLHEALITAMDKNYSKEDEHEESV